MPQLDTSTFDSQIFWLLVCFFSMLFIMSKFIVPRIRETIELRQKKIDDNLEQARAIKEKAEISLQKYEKALNNATEKANESLLKTKAELKTFIEKRQLELYENLARKIKEGEAKIEQERVKALQSIEEMSLDLAVNVAKKVGLKDIKEKDIKEAVKTLKAS